MTYHAGLVGFRAVDLIEVLRSLSAINSIDASQHVGAEVGWLYSILVPPVARSKRIASVDMESKGSRQTLSSLGSRRVRTEPLPQIIQETHRQRY